MGSTAALQTRAAVASASSRPQPVSRTSDVSRYCMHIVLLSSSRKTPGATSRGGPHVPRPGSGTMERDEGVSDGQCLRTQGIPRRHWRDIEELHCSCSRRVTWQGAHDEGGVCTTPPIGSPYARAYQTKPNQTLGGGGGVVLGVGVACVAGGGGDSLGGEGMPPSDESSDSKAHLELFLSPVLVTGRWGGGGLALGRGGGGGGGSSFTGSSPFQPSLRVSPHPPPSCTPSALTRPTPQPCTSLHPSTPPSRPFPAPNSSGPSR